MISADPILSASELTVDFARPDGRTVHAVRGVSFDILRGERVALVGESGSGKSATARAVLRLDRGATIGGSLRLSGKDVIAASMKELTQLRGRRASLIMQDPLAALDPGRRVGDQLIAVLRLSGFSRSGARTRAIELFDEVGMPQARARMSSFPFELSGGLRQRVVIALALAGEPDLLIADEPTSALDARISKRILTLLDGLVTERDLAVLFITHDLAVVGEFAERTIVMYGGRVVEDGATSSVFGGPLHPYSAGLLGSVPTAGSGSLKRFVSMPGEPPSATDEPRGCSFAPRCTFAQEVCLVERPLLKVHRTPNHLSACHFADDLVASAVPQ